MRGLKNSFSTQYRTQSHSINILLEGVPWKKGVVTVETQCSGHMSGITHQNTKSSVHISCTRALSLPHWEIAHRNGGITFLLVKHELIVDEGVASCTVMSQEKVTLRPETNDGQNDHTPNKTEKNSTRTHIVYANAQKINSPHFPHLFFKN